VNRSSSNPPVYPIVEALLVPVAKEHELVAELTPSEDFHSVLLVDGVVAFDSVGVAEVGDDIQHIVMHWNVALLAFRDEYQLVVLHLHRVDKELTRALWAPELHFFHCVLLGLVFLGTFDPNEESDDFVQCSVAENSVQVIVNVHIEQK